MGDFCVTHAKPKKPWDKSTILDSINRWAKVVGATGNVIRLVHDIATIVGPHIYITHSDGTREQIEFSALIAKAESIQEAVSAEEATEETLTNADQQFAELQESVSVIVKQMAAASSSAASSSRTMPSSADV